MSRSFVQSLSVVAFALLMVSVMPATPRRMAFGAGEATGPNTGKKDASPAGKAAAGSAEAEPSRAAQAAGTASPQAGVAAEEALVPPGTTRPGRLRRAPFIPRPAPTGGYNAGPGAFVYPVAPQPQQPAPEDVDQAASCVLQIDAEPAYNPSTGVTVALDASTAAGLLQSSAVLDASAKKSLGAKARNWRDWVYVSAVPTSPRFLRVDVMLLKGHPAEWGGADEDIASKLMKAMTQSLRNALKESTEAQREHFDKRVAALEKDADGARQRLKAVRDKIAKYREETGDLPQQYGDTRIAMTNLRNQRQQYEAQLSNYRSRLNSIEPATSPLVAEWGSIVDLRQKRVDELKADAKVKPEEITSAERNLAEAKTQRDAYRRAAASEAAQTRNRNGEVQSLQANISDTESRLKPIIEQLEKLQDPKVVAMMQELPELQNEENRVRSEISDLQNRLDQFRRASTGPTEISLRVLDGEPDE
jgi:predicted  nucleic acid-binding Zn-ribbon protein